MGPSLVWGFVTSGNSARRDANSFEGSFGGKVGLGDGLCVLIPWMFSICA